MIKHLYKDFLKNKIEYKNVELFWEKLFQEIFSQSKIESKKRLNIYRILYKLLFIVESQY